MDLGLTQKVALVCAASKGLGRAAAEALASEGAQVAMCARGRDALWAAASEIRAATGADILPILADVTEEASVQGLIKAVIAEFGRIDILVSNAGGPPAGPFENHDLAEWQRAFELNFLSVVRLCRLVV